MVSLSFVTIDLKGIEQRKSNELIEYDHFLLYVCVIHPSQTKQCFVTGKRYYSAPLYQEENHG